MASSNSALEPKKKLVQSRVAGDCYESDCWFGGPCSAATGMRLTPRLECVAGMKLAYSRAFLVQFYGGILF
jgi:hypothetical protein